MVMEWYLVILGFYKGVDVDDFFVYGVGEDDFLLFVYVFGS